MELVSDGDNRGQPKVWNEEAYHFNSSGRESINLKKLFEPSIARAARAYTGLAHIALAKKANVASRTVYKLEKDGRVTRESLQRILAVLQNHGVSFIRDDVMGHVCGLRFEIDSDFELDEG